MPGIVAETLRGLRFGPLPALLTAAVAVGCVYLLTTPYSYLALVPGPLILALLLFGRYLQFSWYFFIFLIPFEFLTRLSPTQQEYSVSKLLGLWIVVVSLLMVLTNRWRPQHLRSGFWPFLAAFVLVNLFTTLTSSHVLLAVNELRQILVVVTIFALALLLTTRRGLLSTIPSVLIWGVLLNYAIFLVEFRFGVKMPWVSESIFPRDVKLPGYALPTGYSTYFVFVLPFLVHRFAFSKSFTRKALYAGLTVLTVAGIMYMGHRAAFLLTLFVAALLCFQYLGRLKPRLIGFVLAGVFISVVSVALLMPAWYVERQKSMVETETDASVKIRIVLLKAGWDFFKQKPLLGFGPGTFGEEFANTLSAADYADTAEDYRMGAHNTYLSVLVSNGLVGLFFFLGLVVIALRNYRAAAKNFRREGDHERELLLGAYQAAFMVNLFFFVFISYLTMKHFWIFLAISQIALNVSKLQHPSEESAA
jgi:O-antigen ligase